MKQPLCQQVPINVLQSSHTSLLSELLYFLLNIFSAAPVSFLGPFVLQFVVLRVLQKSKRSLVLLD